MTVTPSPLGPSPDLRRGEKVPFGCIKTLRRDVCSPLPGPVLSKAEGLGEGLGGEGRLRVTLQMILSSIMD